MSIPKKPRKCRVCKSDFQPVRCLQQTCSFDCEVKLGMIHAERSKAKREKAERIAEISSTKILREKLKTKANGCEKPRRLSMPIGANYLETSRAFRAEGITLGNITLVII